MTRAGRLTAETRAATTAFLRRRTAVFFTFFFPVIIVVIFGVLVGTRPTGGGLFTEPPGWYVPGYLAVVVLFTPLSRTEWLLAQTVVNVVVIGLAALMLLVLVV